MIEQCSERAELSRAHASGAMIHFFLMRRRIDVVVETMQLTKSFVTEVAFVHSDARVPRCRCCGQRGLGTAVGEELLGDDVSGVAAPDLGQDSVTIEGACFRARAGFEMMSHACCCCESTFAEGTSDVSAPVYAAVEMLSRVIEINARVEHVWGDLLVASYSRFRTLYCTDGTDESASGLLVSCVVWLQRECRSCTNTLRIRIPCEHDHTHPCDPIRHRGCKILEHTYRIHSHGQWHPCADSRPASY